MPADRDGPALTVVGSCEGCRWHSMTDYAPHLRQCLAGPVPQSIATAGAPTWCPRIPAARLALGRELAKEGES